MVNTEKLEAGAGRIVESPVARLLQMIFTALAVPLLGYILITLQTTTALLAADNERFQRIESEMLLRTQNRYTRDDADRDRATVSQHLQDIDRRLDRLER